MQKEHLLLGVDDGLGAFRGTGDSDSFLDASRWGSTARNTHA